MKQQILSFLFTFILLSSFVAATTTISIDPTNAVSSLGEPFVVSVDIDTDDSIYGAQFDVLFDPTQLAASNVVEGGFLSQDGDSLFEAVNKINNTEGKISFAVTRFTFSTGVTGQGALANITFIPFVANNESAVSVDNIVIGAPNASNIAVDGITNGTFTVKTIYNITINEIMKDPSAVSDSLGEYVELYNQNNFSVDINGWTLKDNGSDSHVISNGGSLTIDPLGYLVLCRNDATGTNGGFTCDYEYSGFELDNTEDEVVLLNEGLHQVDIVEYDSAFPSTSGASMELAKVDLDNNVAVNWRDATIPFGSGDKGTPGSENVVLTGPDITGVTSVSGHEDQDALVLATITDFVPITNVTLLSDHSGVITEYEVTTVNGSVYSFTIDNSFLENQQVVRYAWRAEDSEGFVTTTSFETFTITNRAPTQVSTIGPLSLPEDGDLLYNITSHFSDADEDNLSFSGTSSDNITVLVNAQTGIAFFEPNTNFNGIQSVTFTATDEFGLEVNSTNVTVEVTAVNDAPFFTDVPTGLNTTEEGIIGFSVSAEDVDGDNLTFFVNDTDFSVSGSTITYDPAPNFNGLKTALITVSDGTVNVSTELNITVTGDNDAPEISSIPTQTATEEVDLVLDVSTYISDIDNSLSELTISENSAYGTVNGHNITFNYPNGVAQEVVTVTVSDGSLSDETNVTITVNNVNDAPVLGSISDQTTPEDDTVTIQLTATDIDPTNDTLTYSTTAAFGSLNSSSGLFSWTPTSGDIGSYTAEFRVSDGNGGEDAQNVTFTVTSVLQITNVNLNVDGNVSPGVGQNGVVTASPGSVITVDVTLENKASESLFGVNSNVTLNTTPESQDVESVGTLTSGSSQVVSFSIAVPSIIDAGRYQLDIFAKGVTTTLVDRAALQTVFVDVKKDTHEIRLDSAAFSPNNLQCTRDGNLTVTLTNTGQFDEDVELQITNNVLGVDVAENVSIPKNTQTSVTVPISAPNTPRGNYSIEVNATYFFGSESSITNADVEIANCAPVLNTVADQIGTEETSLSFDVSASDFDFGDSITFTSNKTGMHFANSNSSDATGTWTPQNEDIGVQHVTITATDGTDSASQVVTFTIANINDPPSIDSSSPTSNPIIAEDAGTTQDFSITTSDPDGDSLDVVWRLNGSAQVFNTNSYTFTASNVVGSFNVTAVVSDANFSVQREWVLTTTNVPVSNNYVLSYDGTPDTATNVTISNTHGKIDFSGQTIDFGTLVDLDSVVILQNGAAGIDSSAASQLDKPASIMLFNLPFSEEPPLFKNSGFGVSGNTSCGGDCSNVVFNTSTSTLSFDVTGFSTFFVLVNNSNPVITSSAVTTATINEPYSYDVQASDADGDTLTYSITTSTNMSIDSSTGLISWTPGNFTTESVTVEVTDGKGGKATQSFSVKVKEPTRLVISDLDVDVDGESDKNLENGDRIGEEAKPGSNVEFIIELENLFDEDDQDIEIEDIDLEVTIFDIDDDDDLDEDVDEFDLKAEEDKTVNVDFKIPLEVDEGTYDVLIEAQGVDDEGTEHEVEVRLELEVEKENHEIKIIEASALPRIVQCDRSVSFRTEIINIGEDDEEDVDLEIVNADLGIDESVRGIELEEGNDDNRFSKSFTAIVDSDVANGIYPVEVRTYYDGKLSESQVIELEVGSCVERTFVREPVRSGSDQEDEEVTVVRPEFAPQGTVDTKESGFVLFGDWDTYTLLVLILLIIFVGLAIFIIGAAIILLLD